MAISNNVARRSSPMAMVRGQDGKIYYLINANGARGVANVQYVDFYSGLNHYGPGAGQDNPSGFFFVRHAHDAYAEGDNYGDPDVRKGWAMYIFDSTKYKQGVQNSGWVRIAQQLDVDWDIDDELKAQFVLQDTFNKFVNATETNFKEDETRLGAVETTLAVEVVPNLRDVMAKAHVHKYILEDGTVGAESNLEVLNKLYDKYGMLYYRGAPISGNSYIYSRVHDNKMYWLDPTDVSGEAEEEEVPNSATIAEKFSKTSLSRLGLTLIVVEVDGSLSLYKMTDQRTTTVEVMRHLSSRDTHDIDTENQTIDGFSSFVYCDSGERPPEQSDYHATTFAQAVDTITTPVADGWLIFGIYPERVAEYGYVVSVDIPGILPVFVETVTNNDRGIIENCQTLPAASAAYVGRGLWSPTTTDHVHKVGNLFKCVEDQSNPGSYIWQDVTMTATTVAQQGAKILACYNEDDTMWTRVRIAWKDPDDVPVGLQTYTWEKTILVRKYGAIPENVSDGEILCVETVRDAHATASTAFIDTNIDPNMVPCYAVFSFTIDGLPFQEVPGYTGKQSKCFEWSDWVAVRNITGNNGLKRQIAEAIFQIGDTVVMPPHPEYGTIECTVVALNKNYLDQDVPGGVTLCANRSIMSEPMNTTDSNGTLTDGKYELIGLTLINWLLRDFWRHWYLDEDVTPVVSILNQVASGDIPASSADVASGFYSQVRPPVGLPVKYAEWYDNISDELKADGDWWTMNGTGDGNGQNSGFWLGNGNGNRAASESHGVVPVFCI